MHVDPQGYDKLNDAIEAASYTSETVYPRNKQELKNTYQQLYGRSWQKHLSEDLAAQRGVSRDDKRFSKVTHNISRAYNPDRIEKPLRTGAAREEVAQLGKKHSHTVQVPKQIAGKRARVTFTGRIRTYDEKHMRSTSTYTGTLPASDATEMRRGDFEGMFVAFGFTPDIVDEIDVQRISVDFL